jgi:hypothetical protein
MCAFYVGKGGLAYAFLRALTQLPPNPDGTRGDIYIDLELPAERISRISEFVLGDVPATSSLVDKQKKDN